MHDTVHRGARQIRIVWRHVHVRPAGDYTDAMQRGLSCVAQHQRALPELALQEAVWETLHARLQAGASHPSAPDVCPFRCIASYEGPHDFSLDQGPCITPHEPTFPSKGAIGGLA